MSRCIPIGAMNRGWAILAAFLSACMLILAIVSPGQALGAQQDEIRRVLILHSFGRDFRPWGRYAATIREELGRLSPWQLDIQDHSLITARSSDEDPELAFIAYLNALNSRDSPDIVISIGAPAANFVQRNRARLFAATPMLMTAVEQRRINFLDMSDKDTVIAVAHDYPRSFETILRVLPGTKQIVVINGTSPNERFWRDEIQKDAELFKDRVQFIWYDDISFSDI
ncbi:MAG: ATPase, partial [Candidatus Afipia apatlaquensis]|nr:ATPase [Candidatus Afipia apatlaquensis]